MSSILFNSAVLWSPGTVLCAVKQEQLFRLSSLGQMVQFDSLTLGWPGKFLIHRKIGCLNVKPQYLLNYSSPTNDLYSVRKESIRAFKSIFKLARKVFYAKFSAGVRRRRTGSGLCTKTLHASCLWLLFSMFQSWGCFDPMLIPVG